MFLLKLLLAVCTGMNIPIVHGDILPRQATDYSTIWHFKFANFTSPQSKSVFNNGKMKICYRNAAPTNLGIYIYYCIDTADFFQFTTPKAMEFIKGGRVDTLFYDDNKNGPVSSLSTRQVYPALIIISNKNAYSSIDDNFSWLKGCDRCVGSTIDTTNPETFKSHDGTFWASFNNNNRIITSSNMKTWTFHPNLPLDVKIRDIFPIKITATGEDKWCLVQIVNDIVLYYPYYVGTLTNSEGYINERGPYYLTYGPDDTEIYFANKGDVVDDFQYMTVTFINTYFSLFLTTARAPVILGTPRKVMFADVGGEQLLIQMPAVTADMVPRKYQYIFNDIDVTGGLVNPLNSIRSKSFILTMSFNMLRAIEIGIRIRQSPDGNEMTQIGYLIKRTFYVDRLRSGIPAGMPTQNMDKYKRRFEANKEALNPADIKFLIHADGPILECFYDLYHININALIFPKSTSDRMQIITSGGNSTLSSLTLTVFD